MTAELTPHVVNKTLSVWWEPLKLNLMFSTLRRTIVAHIHLTIFFAIVTCVHADNVQITSRSLKMVSTVVSAQSFSRSESWSTWFIKRSLTQRTIVAAMENLLDNICVRVLVLIMIYIRVLVWHGYNSLNKHHTDPVLWHTFLFGAQGWDLRFCL